VHDGEAPTAALERELAEELGLEVNVGGPITFATEEPGLRILLLFWRPPSEAASRGRERRRR
jgi:8-oxo-dGTP pyrophosphatase MutT (NUDIX family)